MKTTAHEKKLEIGRVNALKVLKLAPHGLYLEAGELDILLPSKQVPVGTSEGDVLEVFIYTDSEDRLIATMASPKVERDEIACLVVKDSANFGAFLDWGLEKDLFLPKNEQVTGLYEGDLCVVLVCLDEETDRLYATTRLRDILPSVCFDYKRGQKVDYLVQEINEHGAQVVIDQAYRGMIYKDDLTQDLDVGDAGKAYIKMKRDDGKLKLCLQEPGFKGVLDVKPMIIDRIDQKGGFIALNDDSDPEAIRREFSISKKAFKKAIGSLYKDGRIVIEENGIRLVR